MQPVIDKEKVFVLCIHCYLLFEIGLLSHLYKNVFHYFLYFSRLMGGTGSITTRAHYTRRDRQPWPWILERHRSHYFSVSLCVKSHLFVLTSRNMLSFFSEILGINSLNKLTVCVHCLPSIWYGHFPPNLFSYYWLLRFSYGFLALRLPLHSPHQLFGWRSLKLNYAINRIFRVNSISGFWLFGTRQIYRFVNLSSSAQPWNAITLVSFFCRLRFHLRGSYCLIFGETHVRQKRYGPVGKQIILYYMKGRSNRGSVRGPHPFSDRHAKDAHSKRRTRNSANTRIPSFICRVTRCGRWFRTRRYVFHIANLIFSAAAFFLTYEVIKARTSEFGLRPSVSHIFAACFAEMVRFS